jgi:hypothetical protein
MELLGPAAISSMAGGTVPSPAIQNAFTESWNGTSWTEVTI